ncbi:hypothetical protein [Romboutsia sp.]|uniref:hypothetical protein n=1 Tax=Romboutsia sp. TaxID=1965302 RepID=UPI002C2E038B|nr:hypothetical protein [Romboutsia sp.]HSQ90185.1 hypothetical protein [Romboutsia sp.]
MYKVLEISNDKVHGLSDSILASGYPMQTEVESNQYKIPVDGDVKRAKVLSGCKPGTGHDCFLKGIIVQFDVKASEYWYRQADRYTWFDYVSSQSKMHRLLKMDIDENCNEWVDARIKAVLMEKICKYNQMVEDGGYTKLQLSYAFQEVVSNCPSGFMLTARKTTNYLQLKTMYNQRKGHKLQEWRVFCEWVKTLPESWLITGEQPEN